MKKNKIKEYYGTQRPSFAGGPGAGSNFYSGRDLGTHSRGSLGTRGADSNFSRRMQALVPNDYYDLLEEEEDETIDEDVVVENSRYSLEKVLLLNEGFGDIASALGAIAYDAAGDFAAAGTSAVLPGISAAWVIKNIYEIKKGREKADEIVRQFLINPKDEVVESMRDILDSLVRDVIDTIQRTIETFPDPSPAGEFASLALSIVTAGKGVLNVLKAAKSTSKLTRKMAVFAIINPIVKQVIEFLDSEYVPEKVSKNKSIIMGTLQRMVLLSDLIEDYAVQKEVALSLGVPEDQFKYRHRILNQGENIDNYDYENPRAQRPIEERLEEEREDFREAMAAVGQQPEYSESNLSPDTTPATTASSSSSLLNSPLAGLFLKPQDAPDPTIRDAYQYILSRFDESLENKSLLYLIEEKDSELEEEDVNEMSGVAAVGGFTLPLGMSPESDSGQRSSHSGGAAFPYGKKTQRKRKEFARKTFGGK